MAFPFFTKRWFNNLTFLGLNGKDVVRVDNMMNVIKDLDYLAQQGTQGSQGAQGNQGSQGSQGAQGTQGNQGAQGSQGSQGSSGGALSYLFDSTVSGLPAIGYITLNNAAFAATTQVYVNNMDATVTWVRPILATFLVGDIILIQDTGSAIYGMFYVVTNTDTGGVTNLKVTYISSFSIPANNDPLQLSVGHVGPQGFQGAQGDQGFQGSQGTQGVQGPQGFQGFQGDKGNQGDQGFQGNQGNQGFQGATGAQGSQGSQGSQGAQGNQGFQGTQGVQGNQSTTFYKSGDQTTAAGTDTTITSLTFSTSASETWGFEIYIVGQVSGAGGARFTVVYSNTPSASMVTTTGTNTTVNTINGNVTIATTPAQTATMWAAATSEYWCFIRGSFTNGGSANTVTVKVQPVNGAQTVTIRSNSYGIAIKM